jgi:hypothetical protein
MSSTIVIAIISITMAIELQILGVSGAAVFR